MNREAGRSIGKTVCAVLMAIFALGGCSFSESPKVTVTNLPDTFYQRDGLEEMPRIDYTSMLVAMPETLAPMEKMIRMIQRLFPKPGIIC